MFRYLVPLLVFGSLVLLFVFGLGNDPSIVPTPFLDKPVPEFDLPQLKDPAVNLSSENMKGNISLLNVWATWCIPCRYEHPVLVQLAKTHEDIAIYGLNYKDVRQDAIAWLDQLGDPYDDVFFDETGRVGIDLGVYGIPETFVLDRNGVIRYKHIGPVTEATMTHTILPLIEQLQQSAL